MGFVQIRSFLGGGDSSTNLYRKAFDSCKLFVYIWLLASPDPTRAPPMDPVVPTLTSEPGYATERFNRSIIIVIRRRIIN